MFNWLISIFIFCLVLFIYLHIYFHLKTSNDLEIYEIEDVSKEKFEELCDIRQPILFNFDCEKLIEYTSYDYILNNYNSFDIQIRESDFKKQNKDKKQNNIYKNTDDVYVPLSLNLANKLFIEDDVECYYTANNSDFIKETGVIKNFQFNDAYLRPYMLCNTQFDIMSGSNNTVTPFKYELNYRNFFLVTQGTVEVKMTPPKSSKYLYSVKDYELFEFKSPINPWNVSPEYKADFDKIKCLEFSVSTGKAFYIPAYWWYSIKFKKNASISVFKYRTYMNCTAIVPELILHGLQLQNIKRNTVKISKKQIIQTDSSVYDEEENINENIQIENNTNKIESNNEEQIISQTTTNISDL